MKSQRDPNIVPIDEFSFQNTYLNEPRWKIVDSSHTIESSNVRQIFIEYQNILYYLHDE